MTLATPSFDLTGRVALVTGSSRGLGSAMAEALAGAGAHVLISSRNVDEVTRRVAELRAGGAKADGFPLDVTDPRAIVAVMRDIEQRCGRLDILVNNAGGTVRKPLAEQTDEDWDRVIETDLSSCFRLSREAARMMVPRGFGRIIMISSINGFIARPTIPAYVAAKHGLHGLLKGLAVELAKTGVTANAIAPGYFPSSANQSIRDDKKFYDWICNRTPMGRWGDPRELGGAVVFLASEASSYVTGQVITVDGGMTASL
jgi:gluconate 5-dehydrogenase